MQRLCLIAGGAVALAMGVVPAAANAFSSAFVEAFKETCIPERLSYDGSLAQAVKSGWTKVEPTSHAEFARVMERSAAGLEEAKAEGLEIKFRADTFARKVDGRDLHLVMSFTESEFLDEIGCYLYDFEASAPVDAEVVGRMLGIDAPAQSMETPEIVSHVWGPPPTMPRTLDTHLTYIPARSSHAEEAGFDGVVLKFTTSASDGEGQ